MSSKQRSWWQEMGAISRGMMFLDGSIATPDSLSPAERERAERASPIPEVSAEATAPHAPPRMRSRATRLKRSAQWLWEEFLLLGGRPTTVRHNDDIDEPFPPRHPRKTAHRPRRTTVTHDCRTC